MDRGPSFRTWTASLIHLVDRSDSLSITDAADQLITCFSWTVSADLLDSADELERWLLVKARFVFDSTSDRERRERTGWEGKRGGRGEGRRRDGERAGRTIPALFSPTSSPGYSGSSDAASGSQYCSSSLLCDRCMSWCRWPVRMPRGNCSSQLCSSCWLCPDTSNRRCHVCFIYLFICCKKVKFSHTRYRALGPELIPVYRQSARRWREVNHAIYPAVVCHCFLPGLRLPS